MGSDKGKPKSEPHRPGDLLRPPALDKLPGMVGQITIPKSWKTAVDAAKEWPYVDPDTAMSTPDLDYTDFSPVEYDPDNDLIFSPDEPWGRMEGETDREYAWFSYYRSLGLGRKKSDVAKHFNVSSASVTSPVKKNDWDDRIRAWDQYRELEYTKEVIENVRTMAKEHAEVAQKGITALSMAFDAILHRFEMDPTDFMADLGSMPMKNLMAVVQRSAQVLPNLMGAERLARGMPTEITASLSVEQHNVNIQTSDDLAEIIHALVGVVGQQQDNEQDKLDDGWGEAEIIEVFDPEDE